ncbi:hypothetical protein TL16_g07862 [Triparma laevis f. inornata]|uniref:Uncharacterized protein n=1 Tax=Triparma laevis f. inornata TaxID=1714386 RepID=A0A9W7AZZ4_9STRA|nr:hypothetical protein TL16_g07862 [Triparma laevis f. inornata]
MISCFVITVLFWSCLFPGFVDPIATVFVSVLQPVGSVLPVIGLGLYVYPGRLKFGMEFGMGGEPRGEQGRAGVGVRDDGVYSRGPIAFIILLAVMIFMQILISYNLWPAMTSIKYNPRTNHYVSSNIQWIYRACILFFIPFTAWYAYGHSSKENTTQPTTYAGKYYIPLYLALATFLLGCVGFFSNYEGELIVLQHLLLPLMVLSIIQDKTVDPSKQFRLDSMGKSRKIENDGRYFGLLVHLLIAYAIVIGSIMSRVSTDTGKFEMEDYEASVLTRSIVLQLCSTVTMGVTEVAAKRSTTGDKYGILMMPVYIANNAFQLGLFLDIHTAPLSNWKLFLKLLGISVVASIFKNSGGNECVAWLLRFRDYPFSCSATFRSLQTKLTIDGFCEVVAFFLVSGMFFMEHHWRHYFGDNVRIAKIGEHGLPEWNAPGGGEPNPTNISSISLEYDYDTSHCAFSCVGYRIEQPQPPPTNQNVNILILGLFLVTCARKIMLSLESMLVIGWRMKRYRTSVIVADIENDNLDDSIVEAFSMEPKDSPGSSEVGGRRAGGGGNGVSMGSAIVSGIDFMDSYQYNPNVYGSFVVRKADEARRYVENTNLSDGWDPDMNKWDGVPCPEFECSRLHGWVRKNPVANIWQVLEKTDGVRANPAQLAALLSSTNNCLPQNANDQTFVEQLHPGCRILYQYYGGSMGFTDRDALWTEVLYRFRDGAVIVAFFSCEHPTRLPLPGVRRITIPPCGIMLYPEENGTTTVAQAWGVDLKSSFLTNIFFRKPIVNYLKRCSHAHIYECIVIKNKGEELLDNFRVPVGGAQCEPINTSNIVSVLSDLEQPSLRNQPFRPFASSSKKKGGGSPYFTPVPSVDSPTNSDDVDGSARQAAMSDMESEITDGLTMSQRDTDATHTLTYGFYTAAFLAPKGDQGRFCIQGQVCNDPISI